MVQSNERSLEKEIKPPAYCWENHGQRRPGQGKAVNSHIELVSNNNNKRIKVLERTYIFVNTKPKSQRDNDKRQ